MQQHDVSTCFFALGQIWELDGHRLRCDGIHSYIRVDEQRPVISLSASSDTPRAKAVVSPSRRAALAESDLGWR